MTDHTGTGAGTADAVSCTGLVHSFGGTRAVDGVDLAVAPGEVFGLLGPNGAGKTTAIRAITTLLPVPPGWSGSSATTWPGSGWRSGGCWGTSRSSSPPTPT